MKKNTLFYISLLWKGNIFHPCCKPPGRYFFLVLFSFTEWREQTENTCASLQHEPVFSFSDPGALIVLLRVHFCLFCELWPCRLLSSTLFLSVCSGLFFFSSLFAKYSSYKISGFVQMIKGTTQMEYRELILDSNHYTWKIITWRWPLQIILKYEWLVCLFWLCHQKHLS